jgi:hypothetical protein
MSIPFKQLYWLIEHEDRDPDYHGWHCDEDEKFLSESQAIEEAKRLAETEGTFFKGFRVVKVEVETKVTEVVAFETKYEEEPEMSSWEDNY